MIVYGIRVLENYLFAERLGRLSNTVSPAIDKEVSVNSRYYPKVNKYIFQP